MSKQSEAKESQGYTRTLKMCSNCAWYESDLTPVENWAGQVYHDEKNIRCGLGGFKVHKTATCSRHKEKVSP
jgi:hypothetical protein